MKRAKSEENEDDIKPYLSGAYIRTFVNQLSSSSSSSSSRNSSSSMRERESGAVLERETAAAAAVLPQKKQVRRRLQTRKPYQEKLLNMAEARREIVTALKLHRAAMKHQQEILDHQKPRRNPRIYASSDSTAATAPHLFLPPPPPPIFLEGLDFALPSQALGLNLNLHDFVTVPSSSIYSSSSTETTTLSSSPPPPLPQAEAGEGEGERFEFLNVGGEVNGGGEEREEEVVSSPFDFDEVMEFPPWLNANESCLQHVDDFFPASVLPW